MSHRTLADCWTIWDAILPFVVIEFTALKSSIATSFFVISLPCVVFTLLLSSWFMIFGGTVTMGGFPGGSAYVSTKYALEGLSNCMAYELERFGIKVVLVEPGVIRTNFVNDVVAAKKSQNPNSPYSQIMQKMAASFEPMLENGSSADVVAQVVRDVNPSFYS